jgi:SAM-dependent methyltransferase
VPKKIDNPLKFAHFRSLSQEILCEQASGSPAELRILDIGCGPGNLAIFCDSLANSKVFGVDLWEKQLRQAAEKNAYEALVQVNLVDGLPFAKESFGIIVCNEVLMYLPRATEMLAEFYRVLTPNGKLLLYNPINWLPGVHAAIKRLLRKVYQDRESIALDVQSNWKSADRPCRITYYSFRSLLEEIRSVNFQVVGLTGFRLFRNRIRLMTRLEKYACYRRSVMWLARRYPQIASDLFVVGCKKSIG